MELQKLQQPFLHQTAQLWEEEVSKFGVIDTSGKLGTTTFYRNLLLPGSRELGFNFDNTLTSAQTLRFSKEFTDQHRLCLDLDLVPLKKATIKQLSTPRIREQSGSHSPQINFDLSFTMMGDQSHTTEKPLLYVQFRWLLPILHHYRRFSDLQELSALVQIHLIMYSCLQREIEMACLKLLN
jgi:hypothetical protein